MSFVLKIIIQLQNFIIGIVSLVAIITVSNAADEAKLNQQQNNAQLSSAASSSSSSYSSLPASSSTVNDAKQQSKRLAFYGE
jgi:hypothetical protein